MLSPETTEGPFCTISSIQKRFALFLTGIPDVAGEAIRKTLVEGQEGIPLHLDLQLVDVTTCKPIPSAVIEIWSKSPILLYLREEEFLPLS